MVGHVKCPVFDIAVLLFFAGCGDPHGVFLVGLGKCRDHCWHGRREHQCTSFCRRLVEDEFEVFSKTKVQHFVGLIKDDSLDVAEVYGVTHDVIA